MRVLMIESILQSGIQGINGGLDQFGRAAHNIATANSSTNGLDSKDIISSLLELKSSQIQIESSASVIRVADENIGTILNEFA